MEKLFKNHYFIIVIVALAIFLRFFNIGDYLHFANDEARDAFTIQEKILSGDNLLLTGPSISIGDMKLGPFFYYYLAPFYKLFNGNPIGGGVAVALLDILTVILIYAFCRQYFSRSAAIISSTLYATSFWTVFYGRWSWNPNILPFFAIVIIFLLTAIHKAEDERENLYYLLLGLFCGLAIQTHAQAIWLLLVVLGYFIFKRTRFDNLVLWTIFFIATNITWIMYEIKSKGANLKSLQDWVMGTRETLPLWDRILNAFVDFRELISSLLINKNMTIFLATIFLLSLIIIFSRNTHLIKAFISSKSSRYVAARIMVVISVLVFLSFVLFSEKKYLHYIIILFPIIFIFAGIILGKLYDFKNKLLKTATAIVVISIAVINIYNISHYWIQLDVGSRRGEFDLPLKDMRNAVGYIAEDSRDNDVVVKIDFNHAEDEAYAYLFSLKNITMTQNEDYEYMISRDLSYSGERFGRLNVIKKSNSNLLD